MERTGLQLTYAYHIFIQGSQLSFGLAGSAYQFTINEKEMVFDNPDDYNDKYDKGLIVPDANFGIHFMNYNFYLGFFQINNIMRRDK